MPRVLRGGQGQPPRLPVAAASGTARTMLLNEIIDPETGTPVEVLLQNSRFHGGPEGHGRVLVADPEVGTSEVWTLVNTTADTHPVHLHLTQFRVLSRQAVDAAGYLARVSADIAAAHPGTPPLPRPPRGWHGHREDGARERDRARRDRAGGARPDALPARRPARGLSGRGGLEGHRRGPPRRGRAAPGALRRPPQRRAAPFEGDPPDGAQRFVGDYVWHCHILEHEENDMMLSYRVRPSA